MIFVISVQQKSFFSALLLLLFYHTVFIHIGTTQFSYRFQSDLIFHNNKYLNYNLPFINLFCLRAPCYNTDFSTCPENLYFHLILFEKNLLCLLSFAILCLKTLLFLFFILSDSLYTFPKIFIAWLLLLPLSTWTRQSEQSPMKDTAKNKNRISEEMSNFISVYNP